MTPELLRSWLSQRGFAPTPAQLAAVGALDRPAIVTAGAGAGKTRVLVERYLHIVRSGRATVDEIVAITFTRKAAAEMRVRLHREMAHLAELPGEDQTAWQAAIRALPAAPVTTIHGFCAGLLREYPVEAGIDPRFVLEEAFDASLAAQETLDGLVMDGLAQGDPGLTMLVRLYGKERLVAGLGKARDLARSRGLTGAEVLAASVNARAARLATLPGVVTAIDETVAELAAAQVALERPERAQALAGAWAVAAPMAAWLAEQAEALALGDPDEALSRLDVVLAVGKLVDKRTPRLKEQVGVLKDELLPQFAGLVLDAVAAPALDTAGALLVRAEAALASRRDTAGLLDFEDLQLIVRDTLKARPELAAALRERYPFVMVDEFQDTNGLQSELLSLWAPKNVFLVGDPQQSIYRFRGAEVEVFTGWRDRLPAAGGEALALADNFRTQAPLVAFQDFLFDHLMAGHKPGNAWRRAAGLEAHVELLLSGEAGDTAAEARAREADWLARRLAQLLAGAEPVVFETVPGQALEQARAARPGDIAVLLWALSDASLYEAALARHGIPCRVVSGSGFYDRQEVSDCLSVLRAVDNPGDAVSLAAALRSPFFGLSDDCLLWLRRAPGQPEGLWEAVQAASNPHPAVPLPAWLDPSQQALLAQAGSLLRRWQRLARRLSPAALLRLALADTQVETVLRARPGGELAAANVAKLADVAEAFAASRPRTLGEFLRYVQAFVSAREREAAVAPVGGDVVQIMTVHQSKGLEFPVVALADTARALRPPFVDAIMVDRELGLGLAAPGTGGEHRETGQRAAIRERQRVEEAAESARVLYVAVTRARDLLLISGGADTVNTSRPLVEMSSWLEWLCAAAGITDLATVPDRLDLPCGPVRVIRSAPPVPRLPVPSRPGPAEAPGPLEWDLAFAAVPPAPPQDATAPPLAVTSLLQYENCPRQYALERQWGLPAAQAAAAARAAGPARRGQESARRPGGAADPLIRGRLVHRVCQWLTDPADTAALLARAAREAGVTLGPDEERDLLALLGRYTRSETFHTVQSCTGLAEHPFRCRIGGRLVSGTMDRVVWLPDGSLQIIDFKTNRIDAAQVAEAAESYRWQAVLYSIAAQRLLGRPLESVRLHFLEPDRVHRFPPDQAELAAAEDKLARIAGRLQAARTLEDFAPRPGERCFRCPYEHVCRQMGVAVGGPDK